MAKRIHIIGAGIAGLSLGILLQKKGFATSIYERQPRCGGLCVNWSRKGYTFNGCVHWVLGARKGSSFHEMWKQVLDIDTMPFHNHEEKVQIELPLKDRHGNNVFHFYNDIDKFEAYLMDIAPEDARIIRLWASKVRLIIRNLPYLPPLWSNNIVRNIVLGIKLMRLLPVGIFMKRWGKVSNRDFAKKFSSPFLRMAVERLYDREMRMTVVMFAQAYASAGVAQYPIGGSSAFSDRLRDEYLSNGGDLHLGCGVKSVVVHDGLAEGLLLENGQQTKADFVVSAADWHWTVFDALGGKYASKSMLDLMQPRKEDVFWSYCRLFIGVNRTMKEYSHFERYPIPEFSLPDGTLIENLEVETYNYDSALSSGKTTMIVNLPTHEGKWWIDLRLNDRQSYLDAKNEVERNVMECLSARLGDDWRSSVEVTDVVTPATFERYTSNLWGSSQGWTPPDDITKKTAMRYTLPGLKHFAMCGHWTVAGGGVPIALATAYKVAKMLR